MMLIRLQGKAKSVFQIINGICNRNPNMTLGELQERGIRAEAKRQAFGGAHHISPRVFWPEMPVLPCEFDNFMKPYKANINGRVN